jgi:H2-forming N5,N10-methylenetetrahydromethanopterin dehydrogenase-like enzyme
MDTIYITADHLGDIATDEQAERMAELLRERGYDVKVGHGRSKATPEDIPNKVWEECLDIISQESYA